MRPVSSPLRPAAALALGLLLAIAWVTPAGAAELSPVEGFPALRPLERGDSGDDVLLLQQALAERSFYPYEPDGEFDHRTASAVIAFHKFTGIDRDSRFNALDWIRLALLDKPEVPDRWDEQDRIEIDLSHQLLYLVTAGDVSAILPVSSGGGYLYQSVRSGAQVRASTPRGDFQLRWRQWGWNCDPLTGWCVYDYWAFSNFYGIHGYESVPAYPASHGCVRLHTWNSDWLEPHLFIGMPVHIWDAPPVVPARPPTTRI